MLLCFGGKRGGNGYSAGGYLNAKNRGRGQVIHSFLPRSPGFPTTGLFPSPEDFGLLVLVGRYSEDDFAGIDHVELRACDALNVMAVLAEFFLGPDLSELLGKSR